MVTIKDGCSCNPCDCDWKQKLKEAYARASVSVNKVGDFDGAIYYPDGSGFVKLPIPKLSEVQQISQNAQDIADLKVADIQLQANITAEETARKAKDENLDSDIARIDSTDARQSELIQDNADRITSTYNDLVSTEATVATHDSEIITLQANNQALAKSLVSDVIMTDGTTAGSVQVSIEREDGALITSANYKWGRDIGVRLEAGTQAGYIKTVISLSDGTELISNEYKIVEVLESDVYVTAITLVPDMTAGTIGGNISYSNGSTQTINSVSVPTAPGVTSAIEALQGRMTAVEQKNTTQDSQISSIDARVKAIEDTPGVGQFGAGKLGTIAGSSTDGRVKAEDDGTGSVNGWSALKQRVTTAEGQIVTAQNDISALDGTVAQQTTDISGLMTDVTNLQNKDTAQDQSIAANASAIEGKVSIAQGADNAGKALVVGDDGNITVGNAVSKIPYENVGYMIPTFDFITDSVINPTLFSSSTNLYLIDPLKMYLYNDSIVLAGWSELPHSFNEKLSIGYSTSNSYYYLPEEMKTALVGKKFKIAGDNKIYYMARYGTIKICFRAVITKDTNSIITDVQGDGLLASDSVISIPLGTKLHFTPVCATNNITYAYGYENPVPDDYIPISDFI